MKTHQELIAELEEVLADKTLSLGCIVEEEDFGRCVILSEEEDGCYAMEIIDSKASCESKEFKVVGHPVTLQDVLAAAEKMGKGFAVESNKDGMRLKVLIGQNPPEYEYILWPYTAKELRDLSPGTIQFLASVFLP